MSIKEAILELRRIRGNSQQRFATELNIAIRSLQLYELLGRVPEPRILMELMANVLKNAPDRQDLYDVFHEELKRQLVPPQGCWFAFEFGQDPNAILQPRSPWASTLDYPPPPRQIGVEEPHGEVISLTERKRRKQPSSRRKK